MVSTITRVGTGCDVTGSAYRTAAQPHTDEEPFGPGSAVYAVYPSVITWAGLSSYVIVITEAEANYTTVYPCDETGLMVLWHVVGSTFGPDHGRALRDAGYEIEVVTSGRS